MIMRHFLPITHNRLKHIPLMMYDKSLNSYSSFISHKVKSTHPMNSLMIYTGTTTYCIVYSYRFTVKVYHVYIPYTKYDKLTC